MKLISHWGIRDELKARYADPQGLPRQKLIYRAMERIVRQEIPAVMVNSGKYQWDPFSNTGLRKRQSDLRRTRGGRTLPHPAEHVSGQALDRSV